MTWVFFYYLNGSRDVCVLLRYPAVSLNGVGV